MTGRIVVSRGALRRNAKTLRDMVGPKHAAFVVKSNAYGHGLVETALAAEPYARRLCVYSIDEALALRAGGITKPILILGPLPIDALDDAMVASADIALWDTGEFARRLASAARKRRARAPVHVKVNTGLNRLGFEPHELVDAIEDYLRVSEIDVAGVFSHLSSAEELDSPLTMHQLDTFERALALAQPLFERGNIVPLRHIAASAAAILWPQTRLDLSRFGIALYGLWPSAQTRQASDSNGIALEPALRYESEIVVVRQVAAGSPIGYGATYHAPRDIRVGVVPAGYADGIPRALSNRGAFLVDGAVCPVVGRVAMNLTEIDLTRAQNARVGSKVTLIGSDGNARIGADDWAQWAETINYEIVARLPSEVPRLFED
ncbi:MAG: alanine racemase [Candidatus Eremiobacteraeota bacterium]|nr:alanine racemase [Candidatus Eremiobacteraeota bacterium]